MTDTEKKVEENKAQSGMTVKWDDSKMQTSYANVVNATSTREEVSIFFGTNQTWNVKEGDELTVQLKDRIVLNPYAAKRLVVLMSGILKEYESRYGELNITANK